MSILILQSPSRFVGDYLRSRDGVRSRHEEFYAAAANSHKYWSIPTHEPQQFDIEQNLAKDRGVSALEVKSAWRTTTASASDVKSRNFSYYPRLGLSMPIRYSTSIRNHSNLFLDEQDHPVNNTP